MERRESHDVKVARIAYHLAKQTLPKYSHPKSKHRFTFQQLAACVLVMFYQNKSYRDMEEWLLATDQVVQVLELPEIPDYSTLQRTYKKLRMKDFDKMKQQLLDEVGLAGEEVITSDSTGFSPSQASLHYLTRTGRKFTAWVTGAYAVGTHSLSILAWRYGRGPSNDVMHLNGLRRDAARYGCYRGRRRNWVMLLIAALTVKRSRKAILFRLCAGRGRLWIRNARPWPTWSRKHAWMGCSGSVGRPKRSTRSSNASLVPISVPACPCCQTAIVEAKTKENAPVDFKDWESVRRQFDLAPDHIHLALFFLASHPKSVRQAIEQYRAKIDANPLLTVEGAIFVQTDQNIPLQVCRAMANYIGGDAQDIALTQNTTTGLALLYHGLPLREGDEVVTTTHDHYSHHESIRLATGRCGATWRKIPLFDSYDSISPDEISERIRKAIGPKTRAVGITWVHSSSGLRLPIPRIAQALAEINRSRDEKDHVLLIVDGVHGIGVEDPRITALGCDAFAAGTHKWLFGPRGTGFVWAKPEVWKRMRPVIPSFSSPDLFAAWEEEHEPASAARATWFSPGGFQAFEHFWALPQAIRFHQNIGPARVTARTHELNGQMKEGLAGMPNVQLYTPRDEKLSAGMVCFDVKGMKPEAVVERLLAQRIVASTTPYRVSYARLACNIVNTPQEIETTLRAIRELA